ncbi:MULTISPECIES: permease-like cell division protein FtsX [Clostridium]|uniref:permease-like cell division protein FtsX n=1 Tax=Clostridium TaxID=1485 RepID=UPI0002882525|nr:MULTISPECIES: permease-like cell division protein FtsX [Clostridium]
MRISTVKLFIIDALKSIRRNTTISLASAATVMATLFILGAFAMLLLNVKVGITDVESQVEVKIILKDDIKIDDQQNVYNKVSKLDGVTSVSFESKKQALENLKNQLGKNNKGLVAGMENDNPLPNSYIVKVKSPDYVSKVVAALQDGKGKYMNGIEQAKDGRDLVNKISAITKTVKWVGAALFVILIGVSLFLIGNTIRLAVYSRRKEINIMKYIGATDWFIRWPFIIEGMIIGLFGAIVSVLILYYIYGIAYAKATSSVSIMMQFISPIYVLTNISWVFILIGIFIGALGSIIAIRKFLIV